jgi:hypothetical protein
VRGHAQANAHLQADRPLTRRDALQVNDVGTVELGQAGAAAELARQVVHVRQRPLAQIDAGDEGEAQVTDSRSGPGCAPAGHALD